MADLGGPDISLQAAEIEMQIAQQELNKRSGSVRSLQLKAELAKIDANTKAADIQIKKLTDKLNKLIGE